ncbi:MAG: peptidylprolyl isomerase [Candidatus Sumerlaeaceae bacterium]
MAQIRVSFSTALFGLSFVICLLVALLFVDRSRQEADETAAHEAKAVAPASTLTNEKELIERSAASSAPLEQPGLGSATNSGEGPRLVLSTNAVPAPGVASSTTAAELPIDPRMSAPRGTPALTAAQRATLSPEALAKQLQGRTMVPAAIAQSAPPMAVPDGVAYSAPVATPRPTARPSTARAALPIVTNTSGVTDAMKQLGPGSAFGTQSGLTVNAKDPLMPFSQPGVVSTDRLRSALAGNAGLDPSTLLPVESPDSASAPAAISNAGSGWQATQQTAPVAQAATPTPNTSIVVRGADRRGANAAESAAGGAGASLISNALPPAPTGVDPVSGVVTNQPAVASPTPNYANGFGTNPVAATGTDKWNLPPAPSLPAAAIRPEESKRAIADPSKTTLLPIDGPISNPSAADGANSATSMNVPSAGLTDLPMDVAAKAGLLDSVPAAKVNDRSLSGADAARRAEALAAMDGRTLDADAKRMMTRTAAEIWTDMVSLAEEAKRQGLSVSEDEIAPLLAKNKSLQVQEWQSALKKAGCTEAEVAADLRDLAMGEKLVQTILTKNYPEAKLRELYEKDPQQFKPARKLHVQEIFKSRPKDPAAATAVERELEKLQRQAASGMDFGLLAMQSSEAPSKAKGGDLGWLDDKSNIPEQMAQALLTLKSGQASSVIPDARGYHIYKLVEVQEPKAGFEGARERVEQGLHNLLYRSAVASAEAHNKIELSHQKKGRRAVASRGTGKSDEALAEVFGGSRTEAARQSKSENGDRVVESDNGRVRVRGKKSKSVDVLTASSRGKSADAEVPNAAEPAPAMTHVNLGGTPAGFGGPDANATIPSTPHPATASAGSEKPRGPFSTLFSKFHLRGSSAQQQQQ